MSIQSTIEDLERQQASIGKALAALREMIGVTGHSQHAASVAVPRRIQSRATSPDRSLRMKQAWERRRAKAAEIDAKAAATEPTTEYEQQLAQAVEPTTEQTEAVRETPIPEQPQSAPEAPATPVRASKRSRQN